MRARHKVLLIALVVAIAPAMRPLRPPADIAAEAGAEDCARLVRELGVSRVVRGTYSGSNPINEQEEQPPITVSAAACFRTRAQCERFLALMREDYPDGAGTCRTGG